MSENTNKNLVGQPILTQVLALVNRNKFNGLVKQQESDRYYKTFSTWTHFVTMMFGIYSRCDSVTEIVEGMIGCVGKLVHFGLKEVPPKSTITDGNRQRDNKFFESLYFSLVKQYSSFLSSSRTIGLNIKELFIVDSTTIQLFSSMVFKGIGRNPKDGGKKKGGLKVHMLIDALQDVGKFVKVTAAKVHDSKFLNELTLNPFSMVVFDKAYNHYKLFAKWTEKQIWFVTRMKDNAVYEVEQVVCENAIPEGKAGVLKEEKVNLYYKENQKEKEFQKLSLRRITYRDEKGRMYVFITNNTELTSQDIADIYKQRWQIELLFKKMKQNFQLHCFYGESENAIRIQIWCTLIAQLLLTVLQRKTETKKAFSTIACLVRQHLLSYLNLEELLKNSKRFYEKYRRTVDYSNSLFPLTG
jgi:Transposase DDE domain/Domain of unknown function (DUF4372)